MSCAHSFGEWCPECIDGVVQALNRAKAERETLLAALRTIVSDMRDADWRYWHRPDGPTVIAADHIDDWADALDAALASVGGET